MRSETRLIIVSGASASGKTRLAQQLRDELGFPLITKDFFKEILMNSWSPTNREESSRIGGASWELLYATLDELIGTIPGLIVESNFRNGPGARKIIDLASRCQTTLLFCQTDIPTTRKRIEARKSDPGRHPGHFDQDALSMTLNEIESGVYRLDLPGVVPIEVDTTDGYSPSLDDIVDQIRQD